MNEFEIWLLWVVIPGLGAVFTVLAVISAVTSVVCTILYLMDKSMLNEYSDSRIVETEKRRIAVFEKYGPRWLIGCVILFIVAAIAPGRSDIAMIVGGSYVTQIERMQELPESAVKALLKTLERVSEKDEKHTKP